MTHPYRTRHSSKNGLITQPYDRPRTVPTMAPPAEGNQGRGENGQIDNPELRDDGRENGQLPAVHQPAAVEEPGAVQQPDFLKETHEMMQQLMLAMQSASKMHANTDSLCMVKSIKIESFNVDKHEASAWFDMFKSRVTSQRIPDKDVWRVFIQSLTSNRVVKWASALPAEEQVSLDTIETAFLEAYGKADHQWEKTRYELYNTRQGREPT